MLKFKSRDVRIFNYIMLFFMIILVLLKLSNPAYEESLYSLLLAVFLLWLILLCIYVYVIRLIFIKIFIPIYVYSVAEFLTPQYYEHRIKISAKEAQEKKEMRARLEKQKRRTEALEKERLAALERKKFIEENELKFKHKLCSYCHSGSINLIEKKMGEPFWKYANLNGSQDMRKKNKNFQLAGIITDNECEDCGAVTVFHHYASEKPSEEAPIYKRVLVKEPSNKDIEMIGMNWAK